MAKIWTITTASSRVAGLAAAAAEAGEFGAVVVGDDALVAQATGASELVAVPTTDGPAEAKAGVVANLLADKAPQLVLTGNSPSERALAGAVAGKLGAPVFFNVRSWKVDGDAVVAELSSLGGALTEEILIPGTAVVCFDASATAAAPEGGATPTTVEDPGYGITTVEQIPADGDQVDLATAKRVVGIGRGLKAEADLAIVNDLAAAVGAQVACSRPIAEGLNWLPKDRYIGVSGAHLKPQLYVAAGISGQLQHMVGIRDAGTIVAIDTNEKAPIGEQADYFIVGDLYKVVPALTEALKS